MSFIECPCGFRADTQDDEYDDLTDCLTAYKAHGCEHHEPVRPAPSSEYTWPGVARMLIGCIAFAVVVWLCLGAPGVRK